MGPIRYFRGWVRNKDSTHYIKFILYPWMDLKSYLESITKGREHTFAEISEDSYKEF